MTKSELIEKLLAKHPTLPVKDIEIMVIYILEFISKSLLNGYLVELRGFGSFSLHYRNPRLGRNPKTGDSVKLEAKSVPHFKAGKELKERVDIY